MHYELSFHSWLFPEYYIRGNSSVNNNIPKNNKHGQYKCNKNALISSYNLSEKINKSRDC